MLLGGFQVDIIVNEDPLPEFSHPVRYLDVPTTTGPSYFLKERNKQWYLSDKITWVEVPQPNIPFSVRFSSSTATKWNPIVAYLVIDGQLDYRCLDLSNSGYYFRDYFLSSDGSMKYYFKFDKTIWSPEYQNGVYDLAINMKYGGAGAVSVYFYRAELMNEYVIDMPEVEFKQPILKEGKITRSIQLTTGYEPEWCPFDPMLYDINCLRAKENLPIAVLHLHYRPAKWMSDYEPFPITSPNIILTCKSGNVGNESFDDNGEDLPIILPRFELFPSHKMQNNKNVEIAGNGFKEYFISDPSLNCINVTCDQNNENTQFDKIDMDSNSNLAMEIVDENFMVNELKINMEDLTLKSEPVEQTPSLKKAYTEDQCCEERHRYEHGHLEGQGHYSYFCSHSHSHYRLHGSGYGSYEWNENIGKRYCY